MTSARTITVSRLKAIRLETRRRTDAMKENLAVLLRWRPGARDGAEIVLLAMTLPLYYLVRGLTQTRVEEAVDRGVDIIYLEQSLGIFWEAELQAWALSVHGATEFLNNFYLFGHLPVIGVLAVWLYFWHRPQYLVMRNAFLISGAIALFFYVNYPTAPPRLLPDDMGFGFVDTVVEQYEESRPLTPSWFANEYAAFPSMHIGWNLLVGIAVWMATKNLAVRAFAVVMPFLMFVDIVLTANHYFIDAIAGSMVMALGLALALTGRQLARRIVSPESKLARERGWVGWMYWLCGVPEQSGRQSGMRTA